MPLSRLDLAGIVEAVRELCRIIETPPAENWQAPPWLAEQVKTTTAGKLPLNDGETPNHSWLIDAAATEVLDRLTPPFYHQNDACPEITDSAIDNRHKVVLIKLRKQLLDTWLGSRLAGNRGEAQMIDDLESTIALLKTTDIGSGNADLAASVGKGGGADAPPAANGETIWFHAERQYSIDRMSPLKVSEEFDSILQAFLDSPAAMETADLESKAGVTNVSRAMQALAQWKESVFRLAVRIPSGKAKGGYFIRVQRL